MNLIKNAIKFTRGGVIMITSSYCYTTEILTVKVKDSGVGIEPEDISKLFTRFGKLHRTAKINNDGIGLGLTIVKEIVESCNGSIMVESDGEGSGSTFTVSMQMSAIQNGLLLIENEA